MRRGIATDLAPNYERDDVSLALRLIAQPRRWISGDAVERLQSHLRQWLPAEHVVAFGSGRTALWAALSALRLQPSDEVLLQAFTCVAVPAAVQWAGGRPVYVDVAPGTYNLDPADLARKITARSRAVIVQHTFGYPAPLDEVTALAQRHGLTVVEDCAHAIGARYRGRHLGTFGQFAVFSFGRDKALSSVFGGAVATSHDGSAARLTEFRDRLTRPPPPGWVRRQLLHPAITSAARQTLCVGGVGKVILRLARWSYLIAPAVEAAEHSGLPPSFRAYRLPNALAELALHQWGKLDRFVRHRQEVSAAYAAALASSVRLPQVVAGGTPAPIRLPLEFRAREQLVAAAARAGVYLGEWYHPVIAPPGVRFNRIGYAPGACPTAERAAAAVVNLPTHVHVQPRDVQRIVALVRAHGAE